MSLVTALRRTERKLTDVQDKQRSLDLEGTFGLTVGEFAEVATESGWQSFQILRVCECYYNKAGGYTAYIQIARVNVTTGRIGPASYLTIITKTKGGPIEVLTPRRYTLVRRIGDEPRIRYAANTN